MRNSNLQSSKYRAILSGNELEIYAYEKPVFFNFSTDRKIVTARDLTNPEENRARSVHRSRKTIQRLIDSNFGFYIDPFGRPAISKFITLTYAENIKTPEEANPDFTLFIKRLNYQLFDSKLSVIKYISKIEFQERGAVHYHVIPFNLPFIDRNRYRTVFEETWGHGFVHIRTVPDRGVGQYITKNYLTKSDDFRLRGNKSYFASRGLLRPVVIRDESFVAPFREEIPYDAQRYANAYLDEHTGITEYKSYSLLRYPDLRNRILDNCPQPATFKKNP
jgi:hypothetical protein